MRVLIGVAFFMLILISSSFCMADNNEPKLSVLDDDSDIHYSDNFIVTTLRVENISYSNDNESLSSINLRFSSDGFNDTDLEIHYYDGDVCTTGYICELPVNEELYIGWYNGVYISVESITPDTVSLVYHGDGLEIGNTLPLSVGDTYDLVIDLYPRDDNESHPLPNISTTIRIEDIFYSSKEVETSKINLRFNSKGFDDTGLEIHYYDGGVCTTGYICELPEGEDLQIGWYNGVHLSIEFINESVVSLVYRGDGVGISNTGLLKKGETYELVLGGGDQEKEESGEVDIASCEGCFYPDNGRCYSYGYRKSGMYCSDDQGFIEQKNSSDVCENSFECSSNLCIDNECIEAGFFARIANWFKNIFSNNK